MARSSRLFVILSVSLSACVVPTGDCVEQGEVGYKVVCLDPIETVSETGTPDSDSDTDTDSATDSDTSDSDSGVEPIDADGDGYAEDVDCNDANDQVYPGNDEVCNGIDDDCEGGIDEGLEFNDYYVDSDGDGHGAGAAVNDCESPGTGYSESGDDCDDTDPAVHPYANEECTDTADLNCDGSFGSADADADGIVACEDCDDTNSTVFPGGTEVCDGADNDCDGSVDDDAVDAGTWYTDGDGDGFGDASFPWETCDAPFGTVADATDCNDADPTAFPGNTEVCDSIDNDCDGGVDEGLAVTGYADSDGDGYGAGAATSFCGVLDSGYVANESDCDDGDASVNPDAVEACDGVDENCDGSIDEGAGTIYYVDSDGDGYGDSATGSVECSSPGTGYSTADGDCDDERDYVTPVAATENCYNGGIDDDCDGGADLADRDCDSRGSTANLFTDPVKWNIEDPIGSGDASGFTTSSGTVASADCTDSNVDDCSLQLQGPGSWYVRTDTSAAAGLPVYCEFSVLGSASSVTLTTIVGSGTDLAVTSHDATSAGWGYATEPTNTSVLTPSSDGVVTVQFTLGSADSVWVDGINCQQ